jgi:thiol:disulfide interchange protein DsbC
MNQIIRPGVLSLALWAVVTSTGSAAAPEDVPASVSAEIKKTVQAQFAGVIVEQVHRTPMAGLYEVVTPDQIVYTDQDARYLFSGALVDTKTHDNLTEKRWNELRTIDFGALPLDLAIKTVHGDGSRILAVFADPKCPYCKELEQRLQAYENITIYTFLYPLESTHPGATGVARAIWCSKDRSSAWRDWMLREKEPATPAADCDDAAIAKIQALGDKLYVNQTPTLFTRNGQREQGAVENTRIEKALLTSGSVTAAAK